MSGSLLAAASPTTFRRPRPGILNRNGSALVYRPIDGTTTGSDSEENISRKGGNTTSPKHVRGTAKARSGNPLEHAPSPGRVLQTGNDNKTSRQPSPDAESTTSDEEETIAEEVARLEMEILYQISPVS